MDDRECLEYLRAFNVNPALIEYVAKAFLERNELKADVERWTEVSLQQMKTLDLWRNRYMTILMSIDADKAAEVLAKQVEREAPKEE